MPCMSISFFFFFNAPSTTEIYTLSLHDALPIYPRRAGHPRERRRRDGVVLRVGPGPRPPVPDLVAVPEQAARSEEHTSELQSHVNLVCRLLLEKKKKKIARKALLTVDTAHTPHS